MGVIEDIYEDLDADVSIEEFREAVEAKVEQMGGLADEETAAQLIVHDLQDGEVETIADIEPGMEEAKFLGIPLRFVSLLVVAFGSVVLLTYLLAAPTTFGATPMSTLTAVAIGSMFSVVGAAAADSLF